MRKQARLALYYGLLGLESYTEKYLWHKTLLLFDSVDSDCKKRRTSVTWFSCPSFLSFSLLFGEWISWSHGWSQIIYYRLTESICTKNVFIRISWSPWLFPCFPKGSFGHIHYPHVFVGSSYHLTTCFDGMEGRKRFLHCINLDVLWEYIRSCMVHICSIFELEDILCPSLSGAFLTTTRIDRLFVLAVYIYYKDLD